MFCVHTRLHHVQLAVGAENFLRIPHRDFLGYSVPKNYNLCMYGCGGPWASPGFLGKAWRAAGKPSSSYSGGLPIHAPGFENPDARQQVRPARLARSTLPFVSVCK